MGRNIDLDDMVEYEKVRCCKCDQNNLEAFREFDIDSYEFEEGLCYYQFNCLNCEYKNYVEITVNVKNITKEDSKV